ncbi:aldehyde dehydrogenase family protein [Microbacterium sp. G2-8]|uniref:aldehyde dehydrogenase family protein n=1 Tax=Microbacterium sp. G2-8 TaxID=2842454 RepID=UPI001C89B2F5|nr:aldehyde dehydrogenase family protein [Microbacterium sp. G2-8]
MSESALLDRIQADALTGRAIPDAATGETIGFAPEQTPADVDDAVARARTAQPAWETLGHEGRREALLAAADAIDAHAEELARLLSREQGKPLDGPNARFEVGACGMWLRDAATTALEPEVIIDDGEAYAEQHYGALGVVGAIGPWNWPLMIGIWQIAPSLRMGNTVVVKPSEYTPLSVLALLDIMNAHLPADVLIPVVSGDREVGARLASHPDVAKLMFTGSTATGRKIIEATGGNLARLTLELGGNDAGIVLPDVDPAAIAEGLFWGAFINTGQTCAALKRLYVHDDVYDDVIEALADVAAQMPMGNGLEDGNVLGPLQNAKQFDIVKRLVDDAKTRGRVVLGGEPASDLGANFFQTTIIADLQDGDPLVDEEQFGPALPIIRYSDVEDAIASANRLDVGLGASVWSSDRGRAIEVAKRLRAGTTWINSHGTLHPKVPFGGVKQSGYGQEFSVAGLKAVAEPRVISG